MVILLNTFGSQIICSLALPLFLVMNCKDDDTKQNNVDGQKNEVKVFENKNKTVFNLFCITVIYVAFSMLKVNFIEILHSLNVIFCNQTVTKSNDKLK